MLNIRKIRKSKGLTQVELAEQVNITQAYLSEIETGVTDPSLKLLRKLSQVLDVRVGDLVDEN